MNNVSLVGRLTKDPTANEASTMATSCLAVEREFKSEGQANADFINVKWIGERKATFAKNYLHKGMKIAVTGSIQTGSYERDGKKIYTTDVIIRNTEFCESRATQQAQEQTAPQADANGFVDILNVPDGVEDIGLPFN